MKSETVPMIKQADIEFQSNLYQSKNPTRRWIHQERQAWVLQNIYDYSLPDSKVLEVGTGCGIYTTKIANWFSDITTLDVNSEFVDSAKSKFPKIDCQVANIETFKSAKKYDLIFMSEVLEHVSNTQDSLNTVFQHLKSSGFFILTTPNKYSTTELVAKLLKFPLLALLAQKIYGEPVDELGHINLKTRSQLISQLAKAGFTVVSSHNLAFYLPVIAEFGGEYGKKFLQSIERRFRKSYLLSNFLWTQCYVLKKERA